MFPTRYNTHSPVHQCTGIHPNPFCVLWLHHDGQWCCPGDSPSMTISNCVTGTVPLPPFRLPILLVQVISKLRTADDACVMAHKPQRCQDAVPKGTALHYPRLTSGCCGARRPSHPSVKPHPDAVLITECVTQAHLLKGTLAFLTKISS